MDSQEQSQTSVVRTPLFPAYSAQAQGNEDASNSNQDWLCNSSYSPATFEESSIQEEKFDEDKIHLEKAEHHKKKNKLKKEKKKKEHIKQHHIPSPESFFVPEEDSIRSQLNKKTFIEDTGLSFERAFRVDRKADPENIYYDCFEQKNIAKYKLFPRIPVGCSLQEQNLYKQASIDNFKTDVPRYFNKKSVKLLMKIAKESNACSPPSHEFSGITLNFIPLGDKSSKSVSSIKDQITARFDGVSSSWKETKMPEAKSEAKSSPSITIDETVLESELRSKTVMFNKKVSESPHDIQAWLEFVDFQDELYNAHIIKEGSKSLPESYLIEKKVAILDKALKHNPKNVQLNVARLNLCRHIWKADKIISNWDELIFLYPNNTQVWKEYIIFILSNLQYFSTPRILKVFAKCIRTLSNLSDGTMTSHAVPPDIIKNMLDIFDQLCFIIKSCGYTEKAIATFQSLIEFNLFRIPTSYTFSVSQQIICLEPFWDSGAPRFGEDGAIGWSDTVKQKKISLTKLVTESDLNNFEDDILHEKFPEWKTWLEFERLRENNHWLPWRPNPEYDQTFDDIDDADRIVSFDDVSKYMFHIPDEEHRFLLVHNFIKLLGYNPHLFGCNSNSVEDMNNQITVDNFDILCDKISDSLFSEQDSNPLKFSSRFWSTEYINFIKNVFLQAKVKFSSKYRTLLSSLLLKYLQKIALESDIEKIENVKKFAKNLLKEAENRNCLLLWYEYIKTELLSGSKSKAKKTAETLFTSSSLAVASGTTAMKELWYFVRSYVDCSLNIQQDCVIDNELFSHSEVIWLLIHIGSREKYAPYDNELIKPTMILKAASGFKNFLNQELSSVVGARSELCYCLDPHSYSLIDCAKCFAYLQYFTQGLDASIQVLKELSEHLENKVAGSIKRYILEEICVFQAELLNFHTRNSTVSMKPLLLYLYDSVKQYPNNARLLHILVKWRSASAVVSPTRRFFASILKEPSKTKPITWIFALASELSISYSLSTKSNSSADWQFYVLPSSMGIHWKIRSLYEKALNSSTCAYIPILWRSYLKFEILNNEVEKAKSIFHRALQNCGWSKELIMDGIEYFPDDLKQTIDFMVEKQIHIRTPLEEIKLLKEYGVQNS
ncbi:nuclear exosome regulator NRDE2-like isoform X2 [Argiope bruennichi]|uniref:nuclear exosome regulator NRDE2-like isoform X2 n=1 Tax=Argiope bruennichi TaxID=94029 RepID=UPI002494ADB5|nr:nuclear exosome regulator NRDE2-like isoform X2 [Argiope bruennichi]